MRSLGIYCNAALPAAAATELRAGLGDHRLILPSVQAVGVLGRGARDPRLDEADVAFGQPDAEQVIASPRLGWVHLTSAGYTAYDRQDLRQAFAARGAALTKSSLVYDEPCAEHVLAFLLCEARQLRGAFAAQAGARDWPQAPLRAGSRLLVGQSVVLVGFGAIGRRLAELLAPLGMRVSAVRRTVAGDEAVPTFRFDDARAVAALGEADHVVDILPAAPGTERFFDAPRLAAMKAGAVLYNIGRGATVDQDALAAALASGHLAAAYLDVTDPEPLPPAHPLWAAPNCCITPHTGGGHADEQERLVRHFLDNLGRFTSGRPLIDRVC